MKNQNTLQTKLASILDSSPYDPVIGPLNDFFEENAASPDALSDHVILQQMAAKILDEDLLDSRKHDLIAMFDYFGKHRNKNQGVGKDLLLRPFHSTKYPDIDALLTLVNIANQRLPGFDINHSTPSMASLATSFAKSKHIGPGALRQLMDLGADGAGLSKGLPSLFFLDKKDEYYLDKFKILVAFGANPLEKISLNEQPPISYHDLVKSTVNANDKYDRYNKAMKFMDAYQSAAIEAEKSVTPVRKIRI